MRDYRHFLFFSDRIDADCLYLDASETRHAVAVLRRAAGDPFIATDGQGTVYECRVAAVDKKQLVGRIEGVSAVPRHSCSIHLMVGIPERDAFETLITNLTALGVARITPLVCRYCQGNWWERGADNERPSMRFRNKMVAALKQSLYPYLPRLDPPLPIGTIGAEISGPLLVADPDGVPLPEALNNLPDRSARLTGIVGPPGGFAPDEQAALKAMGAIGVRLSPTRLTTELACVVLCGAILAETSATTQSPPFSGTAA
jgi:16S rRNA (uracil1498-N3)-methyltransferase